MKRFAGPIAIAAILAMSAPVSAQTTRSESSTGATRPGLPERLRSVPPWTMSFTPDGQPDLQGVWSDTSITPLERPRALQGRRYLTDREVAELKARADRLFNNPKSDFVPGDNLFLALLAGVDEVDNPNATGSSLNMVWREVDNRTSLITDPPDGRLPPLTPEGQRRLAANGAANLTTPWQFGQSAPPAAVQHKPPAGPDDLSNILRCITWGVPKIAGNVNYTSHYQIVQGPGYVVFLSEVNHEARVIPLDGRAHLPPAIRQWNGDSRGRWDKHTLIVETTNFSPKSYFMGSADRLHLVERFTRTSADTLDYELTIDDPTTWTKPWTALIRLRAAADHVREFACHEGNHHVVRGILGGARADEK